jgi:hypothetical protein
LDATLEAGANLGQFSLQWPGAGDSGGTTDFFGLKQNGAVGPHQQKALPASAVEIQAIEWTEGGAEPSQSQGKPTHKKLTLEEKQRCLYRIIKEIQLFYESF